VPFSIDLAVPWQPPNSVSHGPLFSPFEPSAMIAPTSREDQAMASITVSKLHPSLGAEISGIDLGKPVDAVTRDALNQALAEHLALVFRGQTLTPPQYLDAVQVFGPPMRQHYSQHNMADFPDIGLVWHRNGQRPAERWHTDHTNRERPPAATILYGVEIPTSGGGTSVANMRAAYAALPAPERARLDTLRTVNGLDGKEDTRPDDQEKYDRPVVHPMVRTHPVHGSRAVYFHVQKAKWIEGMTQEDSKAYMNDLIERMVRPEITYTHQWRKGDVLVIDDRATMHRAHGDYDRSQSRVLWRIIVEGDRPRLDL
jgi:alpha-ketoglutarate-dependent taurine dioxygenase